MDLMCIEVLDLRLLVRLVEKRLYGLRLSMDSYKISITIVCEVLYKFPIHMAAEGLKSSALISTS